VLPVCTQQNVCPLSGYFSITHSTTDTQSIPKGNPSQILTFHNKSSTHPTHIHIQEYHPKQAIYYSFQASPYSTCSRSRRAVAGSMCMCMCTNLQATRSCRDMRCIHRLPASPCTCLSRTPCTCRRWAPCTLRCTRSLRARRLLHSRVHRCVHTFTNAETHA
jgi:hypothetical protein